MWIYDVILAANAAQLVEVKQYHSSLTERHADLQQQLHELEVNAQNMCDADLCIEWLSIVSTSVHWSQWKRSACESAVTRELKRDSTQKSCTNSDSAYKVWGYHGELQPSNLRAGSTGFLHLHLLHPSGCWPLRPSRLHSIECWPRPPL